MDKIKMTKKEFEEIYDIDEGDNRGNSDDTMAPAKEPTTPEFLTEEEIIQEDKYLEGYNIDDEKIPDDYPKYDEGVKDA